MSELKSLQKPRAAAILISCVMQRKVVPAPSPKHSLTSLSIESGIPTERQGTRESEGLETLIKIQIPTSTFPKLCSKTSEITVAIWFCHEHRNSELILERQAESSRNCIPFFSQVARQRLSSYPPVKNVVFLFVSLYYLSCIFLFIDLYKQQLKLHLHLKSTK